MGVRIMHKDVYGKRVKKLNKFGPDLTATERDSLLEEISKFDKTAVLAEIERESVGGLNKNTWADWKKAHEFTKAYLEADPDLLSEEDAVNLDRPKDSIDLLLAKKDIDYILSYRELQVCRVVMRRGMSHKQAASLLHLSVRTVETYIERAKAKIVKHFKDGIPE